MKSKNWILATLVGAAASLLTGCVPAAIDASGNYAYLVDDHYELVVYQINPTTGVPTVLNKYVAGSTQQPYTNANGQQVAVDPAGRFLYVFLSLNGAPETILEYQINQTSHALTLLSSAVTWSGTAPAVSGLTVDALGRFVFVSDSNGGIYSYSINPSTGALSANATGTEFATGGSTIKSAVDPTGRFLFALNSGNAVDTLGVNNDGSLTQLGASPLAIQGATSIGGLAVDKTSSYLMLTDGGADPGLIFTVSVNRQTGALTQVGSTTASHLPNTPVFDPTNQFLYVFDGRANNYNIVPLVFTASTGALASQTSASAGGGVQQLLANAVLQ